MADDTSIPDGRRAVHRSLLLLTCWLLVVPLSGLAQSPSPASSDAGESRVALIIGNSAYKTMPLSNPVNDARVMARALNDAGFTVRVRTNLTRSQMRNEIRQFGDSLRDGRGVGLFFFAGHGVQVNGRNYLIPVGGDIQREHEVEDEAVDANFVLSTMETAKARMNIVILDACRDNPFASSFRSTMRGLAPMNAPSSTIIAYATAPGQTASDGTGANGLYTHHLVEQISRPGLTLSDLFINVRNAVQRESGGRQTPWELASLTEKFYFKPPVATVAQASSSGPTAADIDNAVQAALRKREEDEAARRSVQQSEIERAVLAALRKREEEQAAAQSARAGKEAQNAKLAIERLNRELAELRAAQAAPQAAAPVPSQPSASSPAQVALAAPAPRAKPAVTVGGRVERPDVRVGDRWTYQVTDRFTDLKSTVVVEVATVTENRIYTRSARSETASLDLTAAAGTVDVWDRNWNQLREGNAEYTNPYPSFQFPLETGKTWSGKLEFPSNRGTMHQQLTARVEGWERVTVPAGTFDAIKVRLSGYFNVFSNEPHGVRPAGNLDTVIWYAPAARQFVRKEITLRDFSRWSTGNQSDRWELVEHKSN